MPDNNRPRPRRLSVALALTGLASLATGLLLLPAAAASVAAGGRPASLTAASHRSHGSAVTVKGPHMWDPASMKTSGPDAGYGKQYPGASRVTVSQTKDLSHQAVRVSWTGFTPTNFQGSPPYNTNLTLYPVMIAECKGLHPKLSQCYGASNQGLGAAYGKWGPYTAVYEATSAKGTGFAVIDIETITQNKALHCETATPCSLLVMPSQGGNVASSNPTTPKPYNCRYHLNDQLYSTANAFNDFGGNYDPCSWAKRIVVPLRFAPTASACPTHAAALSVAGSPMLATAMNQWDSGLCEGAHPIKVTAFSNIPEQEAIAQVEGGLENVALTTLPSAIGTTAGKRKYAYAPVAVTAADIGYWADSPTTGNPQSGIRLNPELVAKLLTLSYDLEDVSCQADGQQKGCDPGIGAKNSPDLFADPSFIRLNPHIVPNLSADSFADVPIVLQGESDITYELTRWLAADQAAVSFLHGTPGRDGMRVNKFYKNISYPANTFTTADSSLYLQNAFLPVLGLGNVASDLVLSAPPGNQYTPHCLPSQCDPRITPEPEGQRELFAIMDSGDTAGFDLPAVALRNHTGHYVRPTDASMRAALGSMITASNGVTQQVNLANKNPAAYPLTMVVYAMVPVSGVSKTEGALIARWLRYVVGPAQVPGFLPGRLPPGYLPLPHKLRAEALKVAARVQRQASGSSSSGGSTPTPTPTPSASSTAGATPTPSPGGSVTPTPSPSVSFPGTTSRVSTVAVRDPLTSGISRYALPALLIIGGLAALGGASTLLAGNPGILTRLRRAYRARTKPRRKP
jgi:hypothetical protein